MADDDRSRRQFLRASSVLGALGLAGCTGVLEETTATPPDAGETTEVPELVSTGTATPTAAEQPATTGPTETDTPTATATPEPSVTIGVAEELDRQRPDLPEQPEPDWTVAADGSGDYESLSEAMRIAKDGEVIELKAGTYEITSGGEIQFVGAGRSETTVNVTADGVNGSDFSFHGLTVAEMPAVAGLNTSLRFYDCLVETSIEAARSSRSYGVHGVRSRFVESVNAELLEASGCLFESEASPVSMRVSDCRFESGTKLFDAKSLERCVFDEPVSLRLQGGETVSDTVFTGVSVDVINARESGVITNCHFQQPDGSTEVASFTGNGDVRYCRFEGSCDPNCRSLFANEFTADGAVEYFIDGRAPSEFVANVFDGADIRVDSLRNDFDYKTAPYLEAAELGNYYSGHDESDEDGDDIVDLPYPISGEMGLTDRYPLASKDIARYLPVTAECEFCG
ncbi:hypothetical protein HZS55_08360 [Halosimplex rubrum]|uniref:Right-handed parallel beta-helix repeat-containing protein n=1 Tax=Halosimplex rubrum TaxID=869889 RepID=A0A7D5P3J7_9EURY|nr:hypothetical protein [Halosimplex rubrum]QLH77304.1 hypothetical protein HZS55_08360 [Halosimplex rubrum]